MTFLGGLMSNRNTSLKLSYLVEKLGLKTVYVPGGGSENCDDIDIITSEVPVLLLQGILLTLKKTDSNLWVTPNTAISKV